MLIEIVDGGAMIGYCAIASNGIEIGPIRQMKKATTRTIGRSMKKLAMWFPIASRRRRRWLIGPRLQLQP